MQEHKDIRGNYTEKGRFELIYDILFSRRTRARCLFLTLNERQLGGK